MEACGKPPLETINLRIFPAKLWRLVNDPANSAIFWDSAGEYVVIDQQLFERRVLSPGPAASYNVDGFKTTNFSSFVRQLNLYGFKKIGPSITLKANPSDRTFSRFHSPYFKRDRPELLVKLKRLTVDNKAKLEAGLEVKSRGPKKLDVLAMAEGGRSKNTNTGSSSLSPSSHQQSTGPAVPKQAPVTPVFGGTPAPRPFLMKGHGGAFSPFYAVNNTAPADFKRPSLARESSALHLQQGLMATHAAPLFSSFSPYHTRFQPGYFSPVRKCCYPQQSGLQDRVFSPSHYQTGFPVSDVHHWNPNQLLQSRGIQKDVTTSDIDLDRVFHIAEEVMQTPPCHCVVKVEGPEGAASLSEHAASEVTSQERRATVIKYSTIRQASWK